MELITAGLTITTIILFIACTWILRKYDECNRAKWHLIQRVRAMRIALRAKGKGNMHITMDYPSKKGH